MILTLATPTGLKRLLTPSICAILFLLAGILVLFPQKDSQERGRISHTFEFLGLSAGPRYLQLMGTQSSILRVQSVNFSDMHWGVGIIKSRMSLLVEFLFHAMLFSKKASLAACQQV